MEIWKQSGCFSMLRYWLDLYSCPQLYSNFDILTNLSVNGRPLLDFDKTCQSSLLVWKFNNKIRISFDDTILVGLVQDTVLSRLWPRHCKFFRWTFKSITTDHYRILMKHAIRFSIVQRLQYHELVRKIPWKKHAKFLLVWKFGDNRDIFTW